MQVIGSQESACARVGQGRATPHGGYHLYSCLLLPLLGRLLQLPHCIFHLLRVNPSAEVVLKGGTQLHRPVRIFPPLRSTALNWGTCWRMWFLPMRLLRVAHRLPCFASSYAPALSLVSIDVVICIGVAARAGSKIANRHSLRVRAGLRLLWRLQTSIRFGYVQGSDFMLVYHMAENEQQNACFVAYSV
ncbi:hypothetical protein GOP47_0005958 [Adiantum capillus-veneris]|uniref:Uncharacterized protein n=1 Tax=Adiantum capillus-veneris TaxID=13818 RepID=A0A9D4V2U9_ADICA|nr:hypothetical protein GOP47_0005958 [Adiantum capillus-veneris]